MNALPLILVYSIPTYFIIIYFSFTFWGVSIKDKWKKILLFATLESIYIGLFIFDLPLYLHLINGIISYFILFFLVFYSLNTIYKIIIPSFAYITAMFLEGISGSVIFLFIPREQFINSVMNMLYITVFITTIMILLNYLMNRKKWFPGKDLIETIKKNKKITLLVCILSIQFLMTALIMSIGYFGSFHNLSKIIYILLFLMIFISLIIMILTFNTIKQSKNEAIRMTQQFYIEDVNRMFTSIRGQRHDFLNHVQVIHGFVKYKKYNQLEEYTKELTEEISEVNEILQIGHPAIAALIQSKMIISLDKKVKFKYEVSGLDGLSLGITSIDIVKILGNLIDNAIDEVNNFPLEKRWINLKVTTENGKLYIITKNPCSIKIQNTKNDLFTSGYSTKEKDLHEGIGLAIVKDRVDYYKGQIKILTSLNNEIEFRVELPLKV
ncbi:GHKL domain-containing protein [Chengkuizengella sediminis]|nr:GHKL domain-containing protein [Chengkuizengella sediminis]